MPGTAALTDPHAPLSAQELRRQHVLSAARTCFARWGFHSASMHQICGEAQMSPGALYRYFPSKESIIEAIAEEERYHAASCMQAVFEEGHIIDRFVAVGMDYLRHTRDPATGGLMAEIWSESIRNTAVGRRFDEIERVVQAAFREALLNAQERGEIAHDIDIDAVMTMLFAMGDGLVLRLQLEPETDVDSLEPYLRKVAESLLSPGADA